VTPTSVAGHQRHPRISCRGRAEGSGVAQWAIRGRQIPGDLFQPFCLGIGCHTAQHDLARLQMNEEQDVEGGQPTGGPDFGGEEIGGPKHLLVTTNELGPSSVPFALWSASQTVPLENIADGLVGNTVTQVGQSPDDAIITPASILLGQLDDQLFHLHRDGGASWFGFPATGRNPIFWQPTAMPF